jgi:hypothetical protein
MIVAGLEEIVGTYDTIPEDDLSLRNGFMLAIKYSILPDRSSTPNRSFCQKR